MPGDSQRPTTVAGCHDTHGGEVVCWIATLTGGSSGSELLTGLSDMAQKLS